MRYSIHKTTRPKFHSSIKTGSLTNAHGVQDHFTRPRLCSSIAAQFNSIRIGDMQVRENDFTGDAVTYSGPTYCAIRSTKHSGSSAYHHLQDMKHIRLLDIFDGSFKNNGEAKPVMIVRSTEVRMKIPDIQKKLNAQLITF